MSQNALDTYNVSEATKDRQLAVVSFLTFGLLLALLAVAVYISTYAPRTVKGGGAAEMAANNRIQKVGRVELQVADASASATPKTGEEAYKAVCAACHEAGVTGAPKFGDAGEWGPRIAQGADTLFKHALEGFTGSKGVMPAKGGSTLSDDEVKRAVAFMANKAGGSIAEPKAAAASGAAAAASSAAPAASAATAGAAASAPATTTAAAGGKGGEALYKATCSACHDTGAAGAPKFGDKAAWAPRIATGVDTLVKSAINGKNAMPPKGGSTASDDELKATVQYMVNAAK